MSAYRFSFCTIHQDKQTRNSVSDSDITAVFQVAEEEDKKKKWEKTETTE